MPEESVVEYSEGVKSSKIPEAVVPGESEDMPEPEGIPSIVKVAGAVATFLATAAGIIFGVFQIVHANRQTEDERVRKDREFQLAFAREQRETDQMNHQAVSARDTVLSQIKQFDKQRAEAEETGAKARQQEAEAEFNKATVDLKREQWEAQRDSLRVEQATRADELKRRGVDLQSLGVALAAVRAPKSPGDQIAALANVTQYFVFDGPVKNRALDAVDLILTLESFPSKTDTQLIFSALPDAGPDGIDVAVRANRRAWKRLDYAVAAYMNAPSKCVYPSDPSVHNDKKGNLAYPAGAEPWIDCTKRELSEKADLLRYKLAPFRMDPELVNLGQRLENGLNLYNGTINPTAENLDSVVAMIAGSRDAIEQMLGKVDPGSVINLDCFLPGFAPDHKSMAAEISFHRTWLAHADLTALGDSPPTTPIFHFGGKGLLIGWTMDYLEFKKHVIFTPQDLRSSDVRMTDAESKKVVFD